MSESQSVKKRVNLGGAERGTNAVADNLWTVCLDWTDMSRGDLSASATIEELQSR